MNFPLIKLALGGGLFAFLVFIHFFADWLFQSHDEAMAKATRPWVRAKHCAIYTLFFAVPLIWLGLEWWQWLISMLVLFGSHFIEDTYRPVLWWAKNIRKPPEFEEYKLDPDWASDTERFIKWAGTPLGKILMITVDQIIHLCFLWVPVLFSISNL